MEKQKKKNSLKVHKKKKETKRKQEDIEENLDEEKDVKLVESANRKKTKVEPNNFKELKQISDNLSKSDKEKKKKRKKSLELPGNDEHEITNVDQEPVKKKKKSKTGSGHVSEQTSPKQLYVIASDNFPSEDSETVKTEKDSSQRKKKKKKKQKEDIPEGELDNSEQDTVVVPKKKKDKKKNKEKDVEDKPSGSEDTSISAQTAAINYLKTWSEDKASWKFQKVRQVWLLQHLYDESKVQNTDFERLLLYLENLQGKAKEETLAKASKIIEAEDSSSDEGNNGGGKTMRARQLMQMLN